MQIVEWDIADISGLTDYYNAQIEGLPHCYPVTQEEFERNHRRDEYYNKPIEGSSIGQ